MSFTLGRQHSSKASGGSRGGFHPTAAFASGRSGVVAEAGQSVR